MSNSRTVRFWIRAWWPVALMAALIVLSSSPAFGSDHTSGPFRWIWQSLFGHVSNERWIFIHTCIRKTAHFTGYGLVGWTWLRGWRLTFPRFWYWRDMALAVLGSALLASGDELHQAFLPNRTGSPWDVLLDCFGALTICLLVYLIMWRSRNRYEQRTAVHSSS
ncbi:MAG TPA: VanZ family protein [Terracidiphilus sp.]|nr:VanZ family protein [Terracidiphilus sp.]